MCAAKLQGTRGENLQVLCRDSVRITRLMLYFFFNDTATTEIYTLSLHDALPISLINDVDYRHAELRHRPCTVLEVGCGPGRITHLLRSEEHTSELQSQSTISYAVFCLKKKNILSTFHIFCSQTQTSVSKKLKHSSRSATADRNKA